MEHVQLEQMAETMKLLSDKTRLAIIAMLRNGERCVCDIVDAIETSQPNISQHLKKLKAGGLVEETRRSQWIYYKLTIENMPYLQQLIAQLPVIRENNPSISMIDRCK